MSSEMAELESDWWGPVPPETFSRVGWVVIEIAEGKVTSADLLVTAEVMSAVSEDPHDAM